jgi:beta-glucosidase-like glycosyl hydrolase
MLQASGEEEFQDPVDNAIRALNAGVDLIVHTDFGPPSQEFSRYDDLIPAVIERVAAGAVPLDTIDEALVRVIALRLALGE